MTSVRSSKHSDDSARGNLDQVVIAVKQMTYLVDSRTVNKRDRRSSRFFSALDGHFDFRVCSRSEIIDSFTARNLFFRMRLIMHDGFYVRVALWLSSEITHIQRVKVLYYLSSAG